MNKIIFQLIILGTILFFNLKFFQEKKSTSAEIEKLNALINLSDMPEKENLARIKTINENEVNRINGIAKFYDNNIDYLNSIDQIKIISKANTLKINELSPKLTNSLTVSQGLLYGADIVVNRYNINLIVTGKFLNVGILIDQLIPLEYFLNSIKIDQSSWKNEVTAQLELSTYAATPIMSQNNEFIDIKKIKETEPTIPGDISKAQLEWESDIFYRDIKKPKKITTYIKYNLSQIEFSKDPVAIINLKKYKVGSKLDTYTIVNISRNTVTLSSDKKSIILEVEKTSTKKLSKNDFKKAFLNARKNNLRYFEYKGRLYSTNLNQ